MSDCVILGNRRVTYDLARLKDSRNGDADDEDQSHRPVNGTVVECVELNLTSAYDCPSPLRPLTIESRMRPALPTTPKKMASQSENSRQLSVISLRGMSRLTKDLLPCPEVHGQSVDMSQPPLGEQRQDVESSGHTADTDKQCLVDSTDVRDEDDTCFIASVSWFSVGNP
jgi:hypothetical protein